MREAISSIKLTQHKIEADRNQQSSLWFSKSLYSIREILIYYTIIVVQDALSN